jgi:hypothetical protein
VVYPTILEKESCVDDGRSISAHFGKLSLTSWMLLEKTGVLRMQLRSRETVLPRLPSPPF